MLKRIQIIEKSSNRLIAEYSIDFEKNHNLSEEDCYNAAWQNAIAVELVNRDSRSNYLFVVVEDIPNK